MGTCVVQAAWKAGDRIAHASRPEWGAGLVLAAERVREQGKDFQRLTVRFDRAGTKTISTSIARVVPAGQQVEPKPMATTTSEVSFQPEGGRAELVARLVTLPEPATDPFTSLASRLEATVGLYRFTGEGASLLDWAAAQTGLKDPLSSFSRHELEVEFKKFQTGLETHLRKLVGDAVRREPQALASLSAKAPASVRPLLTRLVTQR